jgi:hypothetical protein
MTHIKAGRQDVNMRNPWVAIMHADALGVGLRLTAYEVGLLARDGAIEACAENDVDRATPSGMPTPKWDKADPRKYPVNISVQDSD